MLEILFVFRGGQQHKSLKVLFVLRGGYGDTFEASVLFESWAWLSNKKTASKTSKTLSKSKRVSKTSKTLE